MYEDEKARFKKAHGYEFNLSNPQSFNEKIVHKKLFDRNPLMPLTADKYRARGYIRDKIGLEADNHLIPLLWVGENLEDIPFDDLPDQYIIKPNNGAGRWIVAEKIDKSIHYEINYTQKKAVNLSNEELINECKDWFTTIHGSQWYEWVYGEIEPLVIIEKLLYENNDIPYSYKFCMFDGKCKMIYVLSRHDITMSFYDGDFNMLDVKREGHPIGKRKNKPVNFKQMIDYAEKLSEGFDFIRVDFFLVDDYVYFGELTHYPGSGYGVFEPKEYDLELGQYWRMNI